MSPLKDAANHRKIAVDQKTQAEAAEQLNVSERSVTAAKKIQSQGTTELNDRVEQGEISVSAAATVAAMPEEEQVEVLEEIDAGEGV